jgi:hypothetical protein
MGVMGDRITVILDSVNAKKIRGIQAKMIVNSTKSVSFSSVLNLVVADGLKKYKV